MADASVYVLLNVNFSDIIGIENTLRFIMVSPYKDQPIEILMLDEVVRFHH